MSVQTLYTAATGMESLQTKLDVIANNLANVNTTSFKAGRANFEDLFYRTLEFPGKIDAQNNPTAAGSQVGLGARVESIQTDFRQGAFPGNRPGARRGDRRAGLLSGERPGQRPAALYARRQLLGQCEQSTGDRLGPDGPAARSGHHVAAGLDEHRHHPQRPGPGADAGPAEPAASGGHCNWRCFPIRKGSSSWAKTCTPKPIRPARKF